MGKGDKTTTSSPLAPDTSSEGTGNGEMSTIRQDVYARYTHLLEGHQSKLARIVSLPLFSQRILKHLSPRDLLACAQVNKAWNKAAIEHLGSRTSLDLSPWDVTVTDSLVVRILPRMPLLQHLNLRSCVMVTDVTLMCLAEVQCAAELESIDLYHCRRVLDQGIASLAAACPRLTHIGLVEVKFLTDSALTALANAHTPLLRDINLACCELITDNGVQQLVARTPTIDTIDVSHCPLLTNDAIEAIGACSSSLKLLNCMHCNLVTDAAVDTVQRLHPGAEVNLSLF